MQKHSERVSGSFREDIGKCMYVDQNILRRRLAKLQPDAPQQMQRFKLQLKRALARKQAREAACPKISFTGELPIYAKLDELAAAINGNQVVIVCGETGSGKTTQIAKLCLSIGRGLHGFVGHTQPRRIAARAVATRISEELGTPLGEAVGFKIRHSDTTSPHTYIKIMTDGILLAELQQDRWLERYDTLIIDEAHERSLNIDFLLGYIKRLLPERPELKVIITSATIDVERFSKFFNSAPVIEVSGRTYPVDVMYRPLDDYTKEAVDTDQEHAALLASIRELSQYGQGDILIFLEGEREIHEASQFLQRENLPDTDILPLYSRLSSSRQSTIFRPHIRRHIILATNIAETSLTIPGIRYVIDKGYARISRYSRRNKVQQLPVEKISRASADQRKGRCGRVAEGICLRLYSEEDYESRPEFTDPEILRTNLASVILQMKSLKLGDITAFPFLEAPDSRYINDGSRLLNEIQALDKNGHLTKTGRLVSRLPVDPRLGAILVAANEFGCVNEILIIVSALSAQEPRERPLDAQEKADEAHQRFADEHSDFLSYISIWQFFHQQMKKLSHSQLRRLCQQNFISYIRMREWKEVRKQLADQLREIGFLENRHPASYEAIHSALIRGFLGNVAMKTGTREYTGARGIKLHIFPGSSQFARMPKWIIAAELVETTRLYARTVASIDPRWLIKPAGHISKSEYYEPFWDKKAQHVLAYERITLYGLVLVTGQKINYAKINPGECRKIFIRDALLEEQLDMNAPFILHNHRIVEDIRLLEKKARRHDIFNEQAFYDYYDTVIPADICDGHIFRKWYQSASRRDEKLLYVDPETIMYHQADTITSADYPDRTSFHNNKLNIRYKFDPGAADDGVSLDIPVYLLNQLEQEALDRLIPGMMSEKISFLLKSLPKNLRRQLVPIPDTVAECAEKISTQGSTLTASLEDYLFRTRGIKLQDDVWSGIKLPDHLRINIRVIDNDKKIVEQGRDLKKLQADLYTHIEKEFTAISDKIIEQDNILEWNFGELPETCDIEVNHTSIRLFPALVDMDSSVSIRLFDNRNKAEHEMHHGLIRLFCIASKKEFKYLEKNLPHFKEMNLYYSSLGQSNEFKQSLFDLITDEVFLSHGRTIRSQQEFNAALVQGRPMLVNVANDICKLIHVVLKKYNQIVNLLEDKKFSRMSEALEDINEHLSHLVYEGFIGDELLPDLRQYPRYLDAILKRLEKLAFSPEKDKRQLQKIEPFWNYYLELIESGVFSNSDELVREYWRMLEEYRVSLFAQELGTSRSVSAKKLNRQIELIKTAGGSA